MLFSYISVFRPRIVCLRPLARRLLTSEISSSAKKKKKNEPPHALGRTPRHRLLGPDPFPHLRRVRRRLRRAELGRRVVGFGGEPHALRLVESGRCRVARGERGEPVDEVVHVVERSAFGRQLKFGFPFFFFFFSLGLDALFRGTCI